MPSVEEEMVHLQDLNLVGQMARKNFLPSVLPGVMMTEDGEALARGPHPLLPLGSSSVAAT